MTPPEWQRLLVEELQGLRDANLYRRRRVVSPVDATHVELDGRRLVNFASNNYLGLTHHPRLLDARHRASAAAGNGQRGGGADHRLHRGPTPRPSGRWRRGRGPSRPSCCPAGTRRTTPSCRRSRPSASEVAAGRAVPDRQARPRLARRRRPRQRRAVPRLPAQRPAPSSAGCSRTPTARRLQVVVTESIFSMDGDAADLAGLAALKREQPVRARARRGPRRGRLRPGRRGARGRARACRPTSTSRSSRSPRRSACVGGAVCASQLFCDALVNLGRAYVFSTSVPPCVAAVAEAAIGVLRRRARAASARARARPPRARPTWRPPASTSRPATRRSCPSILGDAGRALAAAERLPTRDCWCSPSARRPSRATAAGCA